MRYLIDLQLIWLTILSSLVHLAARAVGEEDQIITAWIDELSDSLLEKFRDRRNKWRQSVEALRRSDPRVMGSRLEFDLSELEAHLDESLPLMTSHLVLFPKVRERVRKEVRERVLRKVKFMNDLPL